MVKGGQGSGVGRSSLDFLPGVKGSQVRLSMRVCVCGGGRTFVTFVHAGGSQGQVENGSPGHGRVAELSRVREPRLGRGDFWPGVRGVARGGTASGGMSLWLGPSPGWESRSLGASPSLVPAHSHPPHLGLAVSILPGCLCPLPYPSSVLSSSLPSCVLFSVSLTASRPICYLASSDFL